MGLFDAFRKKNDYSIPSQPRLTADEILEQGKAFESQGDMEAAFKAYLQAAEMGSVKAMH